MRVRQRLLVAGILTAGLLAVPTAVNTASAAPAVTRTRPSTQTWVVKAGEESSNQAIQGMAFLPSNIYVHRGDAVRWVANSAEIHTVTFLEDQRRTTPPPFNPNDPRMIGRVGGSSYSPGSYFNSGVLANVSDSPLPTRNSYRLTFPGVGDFAYFCLVHGALMQGVVHVLPSDRPLPYTQDQYDHQGRATTRKILHDGWALARTTRREANRHHVIMGADDGTAMVMRFLLPTVVVHVGQKVSFENTGMAAPHTVTFGREPANIFVPVGDPTTFAGGQLNSGIVLPHGKFIVTFTKRGTFRYICALHDYMGMVGKVIVTG